MVTNERHLQVLRHVGRYRITTRAALQRLSLGGPTLGNLLQSLRDQSLLQYRKGLGDARSYYQLTRQGAAHLGLPEDRGRPFGTQSLRKHLGILSFCCLADVARLRLEENDLQRLFPNCRLRGDHALEKSKRPRIYRMYAAGPGTAKRPLRDRIHELLDEAIRTPEINEWLSLRQYAFAILVHHRRHKEIEDFVRGRKGEEPLIARAHFTVYPVSDWI
jgi:hypothetical protein